MFRENIRGQEMLGVTWCPDQGRVSVPDQDDDRDYGQDDPRAGDADGQDGEARSEPHVLDLDKKNESEQNKLRHAMGRAAAIISALQGK